MTPAEAKEYLWRTGDLSYLLWPQQEVIYEKIKSLPHNVSTIVLLLARQFGKSVLGCLLATEDCLKNPDVLVLIIGPTIKDTRDIVVPRMKLLQRSCPKKLFRYVKSDDTYYFNNGSELRISGYDSDVSPRGKTIHKVYLEELVDSNPDTYEDFHKSALVPALAHSEHMQLVYLTTPPPLPDHPFLSVTCEKARSTNSFYVYTIRDNQKLSSERQEELIAETGGIDSPETRREWFCEVVRDEKIVCIPEYNDEKHSSDFELPDFRTFWIGADGGGTRDKTSIILFTYDFIRSIVLAVDEVELPNTTSTAKCVEAAKELEARWVTQPNILRFFDCFAQTRIDMSHDHAYDTSYPPCKGKEPTLEGTKTVRTAFLNGTLLVHKRCTFLRRTLRSASFNKQRTDFLRTRDLGHNDALAALIYGFRNAVKEDPRPKMHGLSLETHGIQQSVFDDAETEALAELSKLLPTFGGEN
jgi:hypothetical protein